MPVDFTQLTPRQELVLRLDAFTDRDLRVANPPRDAETMAQLGISKTNLDVFVRIYVNKRFGGGKTLYARGELKPTVTYSALCAKCGV